MANQRVTCSDIEYLNFEPAGGQTCGAYMQQHIDQFGGYLLDPNANSNCQFCAINETNQFLQTFNIRYSNVWRDYGILFAFVGFNTAAALFLYWLARVPKGNKVKETAKEGGDDSLSPVKSSKTEKQ